jgi:hypothetical protein
MAMFKKLSPDTAVLLLLSKVTQKHFRQPYRQSKVPLRPAGGITSLWTSVLHRPKQSVDLFIPVSLPAHIPDFRNKVSPPDTILFPDSSPFWSVPIHHLPALPVLLRSEILYQSISLMIIIHIFHCCCCILIFPVSSFSAPFQSVNGICKRGLKDFKS